MLFIPTEYCHGGGLFARQLAANFRSQVDIGAVDGLIRANFTIKYISNIYMISYNLIRTYKPFMDRYYRIRKEEDLDTPVLVIEDLRELAEQGYSAAECGFLLGKSPNYLRTIAPRYGIAFKRKYMRDNLVYATFRRDLENGTVLELFRNNVVTSQYGFAKYYGLEKRRFYKAFPGLINQLREELENEQDS